MENNLTKEQLAFLNIGDVIVRRTEYLDKVFKIVNKSLSLKYDMVVLHLLDEQGRKSKLTINKSFNKLGVQSVPVSETVIKAKYYLK